MQASLPGGLSSGNDCLLSGIASPVARCIPVVTVLNFPTQTRQLCTEGVGVQVGVEPRAASCERPHGTYFPNFPKYRESRVSGTVHVDVESDGSTDLGC